MAETFESKIAKKFKLDDKTWMKHANPWSVYMGFPNESKTHLELHFI